MKIALFVCWGDGASSRMVPEGCPKEYADYDNRKKFAEWLEQNATAEGPFIIEKWESGAVAYEYLFDCEWFVTMVRAAIVEVDDTRPWLIHNYDGWEKIWYLDNTVANKQVIPVIVPDSVGDNTYEKEKKMNILFSKLQKNKRKRQGYGI